MKQKRAIATGLSVLLGALAGVAVGVNERGVSSSRPDAAAATAGKLASKASAAPSVAAASIDAAPPAAAPTTSVASPGPSAAPSVNTPSGELVPPSPAMDLTPPSTKEELLAVETRCIQKMPEECERAARALDQGKILTRDAARAKMLNRIALTLYVKQCESDRALACARLAEMHETGEIVQRNAGTAKALRVRFVELCAKKPAQSGCKPSG